MLAHALFAGTASLVLMVGIYLPLYIVFTAISEWRTQRIHRRHSHTQEPTP